MNQSESGGKQKKQMLDEDIQKAVINNPGLPPLLPLTLPGRRGTFDHRMVAFVPGVV